MKKRVNITIDEETHETLKTLAKDSHKSVSQWITDKVWEEKKRKNKENVSDKR